MLTRPPTWGHTLWSWDSVNFALALGNIDVAAHQPHPPGYLGFVLLARALRSTGSDNAALLSVLLLASAVTATLTWVLARRITGSPQAAWVAWAVVIFSPLHWFYGAVAEVYAAETAAATGVALAAYITRARHPHASVWLALSLFAASLVKLPVVLLLLPTVALAAAWHPWRGRVQMALVVATALASAMAVLATIEPVDALFATATGQVGEVALTAFLGTWNPRALNRSLRDMSYATAAAVGIATIVIAGLRGVGRPRDLAFLGAWSAPFLVSSALVHFPKPGYLLPLLPPLAIAVASGTVAWPVRRVWTACALVAVGGTLQYAVVGPVAAGTSGGTLRYADKTFAQKMATEWSSLLRPSRASIADHDGRLRQLRTAMETGCESAGRAMLIVEHGGALTWRHAMYYVPDVTTVQWPSPQASLLVASDRAMRAHTAAARERGSCVAHLTAADAPGLVFTGATLQPRSSRRIGAQRLDTYPGPVELVWDGESAAIQHRLD